MAEKVIKGDTYKVDIVVASRSLALQARLTSVAGPVAEKLPSFLALAVNGDDTEKAKANSELIAAITQIFAKLDPDEYVRLVRDILALGKIRRPSGAYDPIDLDGDFTGKLGSLIPVVVFILKEVYGDFFPGLQGGGSRE